MAIMEICAKCGEEYNSDKWVNGAGTCQDCACDAMELENAALRARVVKHEPDCMSIVNPTFGEGQTACTCGADLKPAPAPLPEADETICARLLSACTGHPHALIPWPHRLLHDAVSHISDLTRRLAEAEAAYKHVKDCLHISQGRAQRAEERIQELEGMQND